MIQTTELSIPFIRVSLGLSLLLTIIFVASSPAQTRKTDWQFDGLIGKVKSIECEVAKLSATSSNSEGKREFSTSTRYDDKGDLIEEIKFLNWDKLRLLYSSSPNGSRFVEYQVLSPHAPHHPWRPVDLRNLKYNFVYDESGNRIEETILQVGQVLGKVTYQFDHQGRRVEKNVIGRDGKVTFRERYGYTKDGTLAEQSQFNSEGKLVGTETYKYELDATGNWTKRTTSKLMIKSGKHFYLPVEVTYRTITYY